MLQISTSIHVEDGLHLMIPLVSPVAMDEQSHIPSLDGGVRAKTPREQEKDDKGEESLHNGPNHAHHDRVSSISSSSQDDMDTPALTNNPNTPVLPPSSPPTPKHTHKQETHPFQIGRHLPITPLLELSKDPLFAPLPTKRSPRRSSTWTHATGMFSAKNLQRRDNAPHGNPLGVTTQADRPRPASLFKILSERQAVTRPVPAGDDLATDSVAGPDTAATASPDCILRSPNPFSSSSFRATEASTGHAAWFCRNDNLVIFDGMTADSVTVDLTRPVTRTSKGLGSANRRGTMAVVNLDIDCEHCRLAMGLKVWKYEARVCERSVCALCKAMCRQEWMRMTPNPFVSEPPIPTSAPPDSPTGCLTEEIEERGTIVPAKSGFNIANIRF